MPSPTQITVQQLSRLIGTPNCPVIIDVTIDEDFAEQPFLIPTAIRHSHKTIQTLVPALQDQKVIVICQKGLKLSEGAAAILRAEGIDAQNLEGGNYGWADANEIRIPNAMIPWADQGYTLWVTRHRPKVDRIACPWLIRRFIDPYAKFLFVAPSEVAAVAEKFAATPFDVESVTFSHEGSNCTFDAMIKTFELNNPALTKLAAIIRGADINAHDLAPECAGLLAASLGISRMYKDDLSALDAGMALYDSFYRWARDASKETHDWPTGKLTK